VRRYAVLQHERRKSELHDAVSVFFLTICKENSASIASARKSLNLRAILLVRRCDIDYIGGVLRGGLRNVARPLPPMASQYAGRANLVQEREVGLDRRRLREPDFPLPFVALRKMEVADYLPHLTYKWPR
jgi:hypothetical protein